MIKYALRCDQEHQFDAWFASSQAYDKQAAAGQVFCPVCGSAAVKKALMAPSIVGGRAQEATAPSKSEPEASPEKTAVAMLRKLKQFVEQHSEYVGPRFAEEAVKIHNEEADDRPIHGEATQAEVTELLEDGIEVFPLPTLPEEQN